jgi:hypothetical protein
MTAIVAGDRRAGLESVLAVAQMRWLWCIAAVGVYLTFGFGNNVDGLTRSLGDTDDATRLLQLRAFLDGAGWYNTTLNRLGFSSPLVSHWSRLIDLPQAILLTGLAQVMPALQAETTFRLLWPALILTLLFRVLVAEAEARGGVRAAVLVLVFGVTCLSGLYQFAAGRIDHHNVMIAATLGGLLLGIRALETPRLGFAAGAMLAAALAVGYEPLALIVPLLALAGLAAVVHVPWLVSVRNIICGLLAVLALAFLATVAPAQWSVPVCDALSLNLVGLLAGIAMAFVVLERAGRALSLTLRLAVAAVGVGVGAVLYGVVNPVCLGGPFGSVSDEAKRIWLSSVIEGQPLAAQLKTYPLLALGFLMLAAIGLAAAGARAYRLRTADALALFMFMAVAVGLACWMMKFLAYASFLAVLCLALSVAEWRGRGQVTPLMAQVLAVFALNQVALWALAMPLAAALTPPQTASDDIDTRGSCSGTAAVRALGLLPPGRIVAHWNLGPYIAALTPHSVLSAPYHRMDAAIVETHRIFAAHPNEAQSLLRQVGATYLVQCLSVAEKHSTIKLDGDAARASLQGRLAGGDTFDFLQPIQLATPAASLRAWRFVPVVQP